jgi:hypothetical protein
VMMMRGAGIAWAVLGLGQEEGQTWGLHLHYMVLVVRLWWSTALRRVAFLFILWDIHADTADTLWFFFISIVS